MEPSPALPWYFDPLPECNEPEDPEFPAPRILDDVETLLNGFDWRVSAACALIAVEIVAPAWPHIQEELLPSQYGEADSSTLTLIERAIDLGWIRLKRDPQVSVIEAIRDYDTLQDVLSDDTRWLLPYTRRNQPEFLAAQRIAGSAQSALAAAFDRAALEGGFFAAGGRWRWMENAPQAAASANLAFQYLSSSDSDVSMPFFYDYWWCICRQRLAIDRFSGLELY